AMWAIVRWRFAKMPDGPRLVSADDRKAAAQAKKS
ncbi:MAG: hypothetical protein ACJA0P_002844, partial [Planctomycetota bacterium]